MIHLSWQNVLDGNGLSITITGMSIVFAGLAFISLFISQVPNALALLDRLFAPRPSRPEPETGLTAEPGEPTEEEVLTAIALALHLELERSSGDSQKITISRKQRQASIWASAGKMRTLSQRSIHA